MKGNSEAQYAAIAFLCEDIHSLDIDLSSVVDGRYLEILGHMTIMRPRQGSRAIYSRLSKMMIRDCLNTDFINTDRAVKLAPLAYIRGTTEMKLQDFDLLPPGDFEGRVGIPRASEAGPDDLKVTVLTARQFSMDFSMTSEAFPEKDLDCLYADLLNWLQQASNLTHLKLDVPLSVLCSTLQSVLNVYRDSLVHLELLGSVDPTNTGELPEHLSFRDFYSLRSLKVDVLLLYPNAEYDYIAEPVQSRLPRTLVTLKFRLRSDYIDTVAELGAIILKTAMIPTLEAVDINVYGFPHFHHNVPLGVHFFNIPYRSMLWNDVKDAIQDDLIGHIRCMQEQWNGIEGRGVELNATLVNGFLGTRDLSPYTLYPSLKSETTMVEEIVEAFMNLYI